EARCGGRAPPAGGSCGWGRPGRPGRAGAGGGPGGAGGGGGGRPHRAAAVGFAQAGGGEQAGSLGGGWGGHRQRLRWVLISVSSLPPPVMNVPSLATRM